MHRDPSTPTGLHACICIFTYTISAFPPDLLVRDLGPGRPDLQIFRSTISTLPGTPKSSDLQIYDFRPPRNAQISESEILALDAQIWPGTPRSSDLQIYDFRHPLRISQSEILARDAQIFRSSDLRFPPSPGRPDLQICRSTISTLPPNLSVLDPGPGRPFAPCKGSQRIPRTHTEFK